MRLNKLTHFQHACFVRPAESNFSMFFLGCDMLEENPWNFLQSSLNMETVFVVPTNDLKMCLWVMPSSDFLLVALATAKVESMFQMASKAWMRCRLLIGGGHYFGSLSC